MPPYPMYSENRPRGRLLSYAGFYIFAALVLGGGTRAGLASDAILHLLGLPLLWNFFMTFPGRAEKPVMALLLASLGLFLWQLLPWPGETGWHFPNTQDAGLTLHAFLTFLIMVALFWQLLLEDEQGRRLAVLWLFAGTAANLVFSMLVFAGNGQAFSPFGWRMHAGFFANENHLAMLHVLCTPLVVAWFRDTEWPFLSIPVLFILVVVEFIVGSRAGVGMIMAATVLSYLFVFGGSRMLLLLATTVLAVGGWWMIEELNWARNLLPDASVTNRATFWANTLTAIRDHWPRGSGFGTFTPIYARYEQPHEIMPVYVNHAHNDWLEVVLEGGLPVLLPLALLFTLLAMRFLRRMDGWQRAALLGLMFVMLHSIVDYPLRTMALAAASALLLAIVLRPHPRNS